MAHIPKGLCPCATARFALRTADKHGGAGLPGTVLTLQSNACPLFSVKSGAEGTVRFPPLCPGIYTLALTRAPEGYALCGELPLLRVTPKGNLRIGGRTLRRFTLRFERTECSELAEFSAKVTTAP
ncbi:MAG: prealbumin-like fold domain-containing protein [Oscillospiraceae bacterium]|jgi:hypothetical protein|nr:prealbumin-like fold domain-containing protein [Oscillospiraceae bacterium]